MPTPICDATQSNDISDGLADRLGICLSGLCVVHCILTPIILIFLPALPFLASPLVHQLLAIILPFIAIAAFVPGWRRHRDARIFAWGICGLALLVFAAFSPGGILTTLQETLISIIGSAALIHAHLINRRLCQCCSTHSIITPPDEKTESEHHRIRTALSPGRQH